MGQARWQPASKHSQDTVVAGADPLENAVQPATGLWCLGTPVLGKLLVKQEIQNTGCIPRGLEHLAPVCPSAFHDQMGQCKGKNMTFVLGGVLLNGCVVTRAGVLAGARSVAGVGSSLRGSARACPAPTSVAAGRGTLHSGLGSHSLPRLAAADVLWLHAGVHHLPF